jgi:hypothetical protein
MRGLRLPHLAVFVCVAACSPSKAIEQTCVPPGSNCAVQQAPGNQHYQELALVAAHRFGSAADLTPAISRLVTHAPSRYHF